MTRTQRILAAVKDYSLIVVGSAILAVALDVFLVPNKIASGGITGVATVIFHLSSGYVPVGIAIIVMNIPLFIIGLKVLGRMFMFKSGISILLLSVFVDILEPYTARFAQNYLTDLTNPGSNTDLLLFCIFGGVMMGVGIGLVFRAGGTTGGSDIVASLIHRVMPNATIGQLLLALDGLVVLSAAIAFRSLLLGLYAIVAIYISTKIIDTILEGVNFAKSVYIISDYPEDLAGIILKDLGRGVTALEGTGMYTHKSKKVLFCVLERTQIPRLKMLVKQLDPKAFIVMTDIREVLGEFNRSRR
ncbi:MAG: YitT family protein [Saccharofermentanales bacterium]